jgi:hypothetical protein
MFFCFIWPKKGRKSGLALQKPGQICALSNAPPMPFTHHAARSLAADYDPSGSIPSIYTNHWIGPMRAFLIDAFQQSVEPVEIEPTLAGIRQAIGFDTIDSDPIDGGDDRLFFDDECFLRVQSHPGRFRLDSLPPVAGRGLVAAGDLNAPREPLVSLEALRARVKFS